MYKIQSQLVKDVAWPNNKACTSQAHRIEDTGLASELCVLFNSLSTELHRSSSTKSILFKQLYNRESKSIPKHER